MKSLAAFLKTSVGFGVVVVVVVLCDTNWSRRGGARIFAPLPPELLLFFHSFFRQFSRLPLMTCGCGGTMRQKPRYCLVPVTFSTTKAPIALELRQLGKVATWHFIFTHVELPATDNCTSGAENYKGHIVRSGLQEWLWRKLASLTWSLCCCAAVNDGSWYAKQSVDRVVRWALEQHIHRLMVRMNCNNFLIDLLPRLDRGISAFSVQQSRCRSSVPVSFSAGNCGWSIHPRKSIVAGNGCARLDKDASLSISWPPGFHFN